MGSQMPRIAHSLASTSTPQPSRPRGSDCLSRIRDNLRSWPTLWRATRCSRPPSTPSSAIRPMSTSANSPRPHSRERIDALRERFRTARGNFDLYVLFIERALELLRPGGRCGLIIPEQMGHARLCPALPRAAAGAGDDRTRHRSCLTQRVLSRRPASIRTCSCSRKQPTAVRTIHWPRIVPQTVLVHAISLQSLDVESRVATQPLGELATLSCGTPAISAQRIAADCSMWKTPGKRDAPDLADFITSGNIDRYAIRLGNVRYLNRTYVRAAAAARFARADDRPSGGCSLAQDRHRRHVAAARSGLGRPRPGPRRASLCRQRVSGRSVLSARPAQLQAALVPLPTRFAAKRLGGGYLAINKGQLARLPIVVGTFIRVPSVRQRQSLQIVAATALGQAGSLPPTKPRSTGSSIELYRLTERRDRQRRGAFRGTRRGAGPA